MTLQRRVQSGVIGLTEPTRNFHASKFGARRAEHLACGQDNSRTNCYVVVVHVSYRINRAPPASSHHPCSYYHPACSPSRHREAFHPRECRAS